MENMSVFDVISFLASVTSLILAIVAIAAAKNSEREVRANFEKTQRVMAEYQDKTKDVLAEIDKRAAVIERTVTESQRHLMDTMTNIINETVIPKKPDAGEQMGLQFMQQMLANPAQAGESMKGLPDIMQIINAHEKK